MYGRGSQHCTALHVSSGTQHYNEIRVLGEHSIALFPMFLGEHSITLYFLCLAEYIIALFILCVFGKQNTLVVSRTITFYSHDVSLYSLSVAENKALHCMSCVSREKIALQCIPCVCWETQNCIVFPMCFGKHNIPLIPCVSRETRRFTLFPVCLRKHNIKLYSLYISGNKAFHCVPCVCVSGNKRCTVTRGTQRFTVFLVCLGVHGVSLCSLCFSGNTALPCIPCV